MNNDQITSESSTESTVPILSSNDTKRSRSKNKNQFQVWTAALPIYTQSYHVYMDRGEQKKFYELIATECGYAGQQAARNAATKYIQKWVDVYVANTGPNNTGGSKIDLQAVTKQKQVPHSDLEALIQLYIPFLGTKRRHGKQIKNDTNKHPNTGSKPQNAKDAIADLTLERKRGVEWIKDVKYLESKRTKNDNTARLALMDQLALAYKEKKQCVQDKDVEMAEFWNTQVQDLKKKLSNIIVE